MTALELSLRTTARSLDRASLEALSNRGLVRRAEKDLERGAAVAITSAGDRDLVVQVGEWEVWLDAQGFARSRCRCPAAGVCQHVVMAILFLQREVPGAATGLAPDAPGVSANVDPVAEWLGLDAKALTEWAGTPAFRQGIALASSAEAEVEVGAVVHVRFRARNIEVRLLPGMGLGGAITSGRHSGDEHVHVVAAVIQVQRSRGIAWELPVTGGALEENEGAPRSRGEVVDSCSRLARELVTQGLARLSDGLEARLMTLGMSALAVNLPRLSHLLRAMGDEVVAVRKRDARGDSERLLAGLAELEALCGALAASGDSARPDLVGVHRVRFDEVGTIDLTGVAAWPWETASGYFGLTVLFWDASARAWSTWSEARPKSAGMGFDPVARFGFPGPWDGVGSPRAAARSQVRLLRARRSVGGRLSASSQTRGMILGASAVASCGMRIVEDWSEVEAIWRASAPVGLAPGNPLGALVALRVGQVGARTFDEVRQTLSWELADHSGRCVSLEVGFTAFQEPAIQCLESMAPEVLSGGIVVGRLLKLGARWGLLPFTVHPASGPGIHLGFAAAGRRSGEPGAVPGHSAGSLAEEADEGVGSMDDEALDPLCPPELARSLDPVDALLLAIAEGGIGAGGRRMLTGLPEVKAALRSDGLTGLATCLATLSRGDAPGAALLRAVYVSRVLRRLGANG